MLPNALVLRKPASELSKRRRHTRLTANGATKCSELEELLMCLAVEMKEAEHEGDIEGSEDAFETLVLGFGVYVEERFHVWERLPPPLRMNRTIDSFSASDCYHFFRFTKQHLHELLGLFDFADQYCDIGRGELMMLEEVLLRGLYELVSGETQHKIAVNVFGRDHSSQSRAFSYFINYMPFQWSIKSIISFIKQHKKTNC